MAAPADSSGAKTPVARLIWTDPALAPALRLIAAISVAETVRSAVTTTLSEAASTYQAMPSTPERSTAELTADSSCAAKRSEDAAAAAGTAYADAATRHMVAPSSLTVRAVRPRTDVRAILTGSSRG